MTGPKFSIVIPTLNAARFLDDTLTSLAAAIGALPSSVGVEVIGVDGGSTDATVAMLRAAPFPIEVISEAELSQPAALNRGFALATGEIHSWLNADDQLTRDALRTVADHFTTHPASRFVYGHAVAISASGRRYGPRQHVRRVSSHIDLAHGDVIVQPASFWRRSLVGEIGPLRTDLDFVFDYEFFLRCARHTTLDFIPATLAVERLHASAKTARGGLERVREIESVLLTHTGEVGNWRDFRGEAVAAHWDEALRLAARGHLRQARRVLRDTPPAWGHVTRACARILAGLPAGPRSLTWSTLMLNAVRCTRRGIPLAPPALDPTAQRRAQLLETS